MNGPTRVGRARDAVVRAACAALALAAFRTTRGTAAERTLQVSERAAGLTRAGSVPERKLRGYGTVSGTRWTSPDGAILEIQCESVGHAKLLHSKYLSDLHVLPGVESATKRLGRTPVEINEVAQQGAIAAVRSGDKVHIAAATSSDDLRKLVGALTGPWGGASTTPEVEVPMWLDRWDKYGFRFYYAPMSYPPASYMPEGVPVQKYDFREDFEFARDHGAGLVMWATSSPQGPSENMTTEPAWHWVQNWAKEYRLPVGVNLSAYSYNMPNWLANRYRERLSFGMPDYLGESMTIAGWRGTDGKVGEVPWGDNEIWDAYFASLQQIVRQHAGDPNVTTWLEPHGEFGLAGDDFTGYGPAVDESFRKYLEKRYPRVSDLNRAWGTSFRSAREVKAFELAHFMGWGPEALDLAGPCRIGYPEDGKDVPPEWYAADFDDSEWTEAVAPGDDRNFFRPKKRAVFRWTFDVPARWLGKHKRVWMFLFDLSTAWDAPVSIWLNGRKIGEDLCRHPHAHRTAVEATAALKTGRNRLAIYLPHGYVAYRMYLTPWEPKQYPALGKELNRQWVDYIDWRMAMRMDSARRGVEVIREVDPDRQIDFMAPHLFTDGLKGLADEYGANFKDTGFMSGLWADLLPSLMRGSGMPFSLEPGGPAGDVWGFRRMLGLWHSEGNNGIDYFIHLGCVSWNREIRAVYDETLPLYKVFGKYHAPRADVAFLWSNYTEMLTGYPWVRDSNIVCGMAWDCRQVPESLLGTYPRDGITDSDFARGNASKYRVVIDTNTSIMSGELLGEIEKYCRQGGIFVTLGQSGRHSPDEPDSWPIERLTGYKVLTREKYHPGTPRSRGDFPADDPDPGSPWQTLKHAPGNEIYPEDQKWMDNGYLTGLRMEKVAKDAQDLVLWRDGTVAVGMRKLGKGCVVEWGPKANGFGVGMDPVAFAPLLDWAGARRHAAWFQKDAGGNCIFREYSSNNGLYDVWSLFNEQNVEARGSINMKKKRPADALDVLTGKRVPVKDGVLAIPALPGNETRIFLTAKNEIARAPLAWFDLQRDWWRGTAPVRRPFPKLDTRYTRSLNDGWAWHPVADDAEAEKFAQPGFDDSKWERMPLGIWTSPNRQGISRAAFRRSFTVPKEWTDGRIALWTQGTSWPHYVQRGRTWLDGKVVRNWSGETEVECALEDVLRAGDTHMMMIEVQTDTTVGGLPGSAWLRYVPTPVASIDLLGTWETSNDPLVPTGTIEFPNTYRGQRSFRRIVDVPAKHRDKAVVLIIRSDRRYEAMINGNLVRWLGGPTKGGNELNLTPFIRFGEKNDLQLLGPYDCGFVTSVALGFYAKGTYP